MGAISCALEYLVDTWAVIMTAMVFAYHYIINRHRHDLIAASFSVAAMYCVGHLTLEWINTLPADTVNSYRYSSRFLLYVFGLGLLGYFTRGTRPSYITYVTASILGVCAVLQMALHIDRNTIGLNHLAAYLAGGDRVINAHFDTGYWVLWDIYTNVLNTSSMVLVAFLLLGDDIRKLIKWK